MQYVIWYTRNRIDFPLHYCVIPVRRIADFDREDARPTNDGSSLIRPWRAPRRCRIESRTYPYLPHIYPRTDRPPKRRVKNGARIPFFINVSRTVYAKRCARVTVDRSKCNRLICVWPRSNTAETRRLTNAPYWSGRTTIAITTM